MKERQSYRLQNRAQIEAAIQKASLDYRIDAITDDNLGHEYRWWQ